MLPALAIDGPPSGSAVRKMYEISEELLATLWNLVPRQDYNVILEDLIWRSAFRAANLWLGRRLTRIPGVFGAKLRAA